MVSKGLDRTSHFPFVKESQLSVVSGQCGVPVHQFDFSSQVITDNGH
jgi:hypothetical protein